MKVTRPLLAVLLSMSLAIACDDDSSDGDVVVEQAPPSQTQPTPALANPEVEISLKNSTFASPCLFMTMLDMQAATHQIAFDDANGYSTKDAFFLGDTCGVSPYMTLETKGTYVDGGKQPENAGIANIDFTVTEAYLTLHTERILTTFNANAYCGKNDWKLDEKVSLATVNCDFVPNHIGSTINDIYSIEEESLYFGSKLALTPKAGEARPASVDRDIKYESVKLGE